MRHQSDPGLVRQDHTAPTQPRRRPASQLRPAPDRARADELGRRTREYVTKKRAEGHTTKEIIRCLKRAIAREVFTLLTNPVEVPRIDDLRPLRQTRRISLETAARELGVWPIKISNIERGKRRDDTFATTYRQWLTTA